MHAGGATRGLGVRGYEAKSMHAERYAVSGRPAQGCLQSTKLFHFRASYCIFWIVAKGARHAVVGAQGLVGGDHDVELVGQAGHVADAALPMVLCACAHHQ